LPASDERSQLALPGGLGQVTPVAV
jgi:hypothetical protein